MYIARNSPDWYSDLLTIADLDLFLQSEQIGAAFVNVVSGGVPYPLAEWSSASRAARGEALVVEPEKLLALYLGGATVILNQVHGSIPSVALACRKLTRELGFRTRANVYITPPASQGFDRHSDDHEILILVVAGAKKFILFPEGSEAVEINLSAGDLLYIPRGLSHEARTHASSSVHISLGLQPVYEFQLLEELAGIAKTDPSFQNPVSGSPVEGLPDRELNDTFLQKVQNLLKITPAEVLRARRFRSLAHSLPRALPDRLSDLLALNDITPDSVVGARAGLLVIFEEQGEDLRIQLGNKSLTVRKFLRPAVEQLLEGTPVEIRQIRCLIPDDAKVSFIRPFIEQGLVSILRP